MPAEFAHAGQRSGLRAGRRRDHDPALRAAYATCRALNARHGRTYFLATRLLPAGPAARRARALRLRPLRRRDRRRPRRRPPGRREGRPAGRAGRADWRPRSTALRRRTPSSPRSPTPSAATTSTGDHFADFLVSMRMDTTVTDYATFADLDRYVHGSAAVIGLQMLPILGTTGCRARRPSHRRRAGRGVPAHELPARRRRGPRPRPRLPARRRAGGVRRRPGAAGLVRGGPGVPIRASAARWPTWSPTPAAIYRRAAAGHRHAGAGVAGLRRPARSRLYGGILDEIERAGYDVLHRRVAVPNRRRAAVAVPGLARALVARARS